MLAAMLVVSGGCSYYPYCDDPSDLVPASTVDTADWPEGWPDAWDKIKAAQGTWLAAARLNDEPEDPLGDLYVRLQVDEDSLVLLPKNAHMECLEQDAEGTIEITWPDGSSEVYAAEVKIYLAELPEHDGVFGEYLYVGDSQSIEFDLYGDGGLAGVISWPGSGTARVEAGPEDRIEE